MAINNSGGKDKQKLKKDQRKTPAGRNLNENIKWRRVAFILFICFERYRDSTSSSIWGPLTRLQGAPVPSRGPGSGHCSGWGFSELNDPVDLQQLKSNIEHRSDVHSHVVLSDREPSFFYRASSIFSVSS